MAGKALYDDGLIQLDTDGVTIRRYYFPLGTRKFIPYRRIRGVKTRAMGAFSGKGRIWGSGDFTHWYSLDMQRGSKTTAILLDLGSWVEPVLTPERPDEVLGILRQYVTGA